MFNGILDKKIEIVRFVGGCCESNSWKTSLLVFVIKTNRSKEQIMSCVDEQGRLRVTPGINSLENAVYEAHIFGIAEIFLLDGTHDEKSEQVVIDNSVSIVV